jgi:hypothetical protein
MKRILRPVYGPLLSRLFARWPRLDPSSTVLDANHRPTYCVGGLATNVSDGWRTPRFKEAYGRAWDGIEARGLGNRHDYRAAEWKCHTACWAAETAKRLDGDFVECGVGFGITSGTMLNYTETPTFWLIDAWGSDVPLDAGETYHRYATADDARHLFATFPQARVVHGIVPAILSTLPIERVAYLHIDMNSWQADLAALEYLWPRLVPGGLVIIDDFGFGGFERTKAAIEGFAMRNGTAVLYSPVGPGIMVKT